MWTREKAGVLGTDADTAMSSEQTSVQEPAQKKLYHDDQKVPLPRTKPQFQSGPVKDLMKDDRQESWNV